MTPSSSATLESRQPFSLGWLLLFVLLCAVPVVFVADFSPPLDLQHGFRQGLKSWGMHYIFQWAIILLVDLVRFGSGGFVLGWLLAQRMPSAHPWRRLLTGLIIGLALLGLISALEMHVFHFSWSPLPRILFLQLGVWVGESWRRSRRACLLVVPKCGALILMGVLAAAGGITGLLEEATIASTADDNSLPTVSLRSLMEEYARVNSPEVRLTESDLNRLANSLQAELQLPANLEIRLTDSAGVLRLGIPGQHFGQRGRELNLVLQLAGGVSNGEPDCRIHSLRVGGLRLPAFQARHVLDSLLKSLQSDRKAGQVLSQIEVVRVEDQTLYLRAKTPVRAVALTLAFNQSLLDSRLPVAVTAQIEQFNRLLPADNKRPVALEDVLGPAFQLAAERSANSDSTLEVQAILLALGVLTGPPELAESVPFTLPAFSPRSGARLTLHGRADWAKHFCISAAMTVMFDEALSRWVGLLKEEQDTDRDAKGFSFTDLMMDRAGIRFAAHITHSPGIAARALARLSTGLQIGDYVPDPHGLPENLSRERLQEEYGGINGDQFNQLSRQINRDLVRLKGYQNSLAP